MDFNEYQKLARTTAMYPSIGRNIYYPVIGLGGESGEVLEKIKKVMRDKNGKIDEKTSIEIIKELGDVMWYVANIACELQIDLEEIAKINIDKLSSRKKRNKLNGDGDNR